VAVGGTGVLFAVVGLAGRAGAAAPPVGRRGLPWLGWLAAVVGWEVLTLLDDDLPTLSDLADPVLAHPPVPGAATVGSLVAGAWLLARSSHRPDQHERQHGERHGLDVLLATGVALESSARRGDGWATAAQALGASMRITRGEPYVPRRVQWRL
jgi:hypothetical protein